MIHAAKIEFDGAPVKFFEQQCPSQGNNITVDSDEDCFELSFDRTQDGKL